MARLEFSSFALVPSLVARSAHCALRTFFIICSRILNLEKSSGLYLIFNSLKLFVPLAKCLCLNVFRLALAI